MTVTVQLLSAMRKLYKGYAEHTSQIAIHLMVGTTSFQPRYNWAPKLTVFFFRNTYLYRGCILYTFGLEESGGIVYLQTKYILSILLRCQEQVRMQRDTEMSHHVEQKRGILLKLNQLESE